MDKEKWFKAHCNVLTRVTDKNVSTIVRDCGRNDYFESNGEKIMSLLDTGAKLGHPFRSLPWK